MTPRLFSHLVERHNEKVKREDRRAGEIVAILYNANRNVEKDPAGIEWQDVFTEWKEPEREQSEEEMLANMRLWAEATRGTLQA